MFATVREAGEPIEHVPRSALRYLVDAAAPAGTWNWPKPARQPWSATLPDRASAHALQAAPSSCSGCRRGAAGYWRASPMRDQLAGELLLVRAGPG